MASGGAPLVFFLIGCLIVVVALLVGKFGRRTVSGRLPGTRDGGSGPWYAISHDEGGDDANAGE